MKRVNLHYLPAGAKNHVWATQAKAAQMERSVLVGRYVDGFAVPHFRCCYNRHAQMAQLAAKIGTSHA